MAHHSTDAGSEIVLTSSHKCMKSALKVDKKMHKILVKKDFFFNAQRNSQLFTMLAFK